MSKFQDVLKKFALTEESFTDNDLKEMGTNDARSLKDDEEWVKVLQNGSYLMFKNKEDTQLNSSQYKKYRQAAMIELVKAGVLHKSFINDKSSIKESDEILEDKQFVDEISKIDAKTKSLNKNFGKSSVGTGIVNVLADNEDGFRLQFFMGISTPGGSTTLEEAKKEYLKEWKNAIAALEEAVAYCEKHEKELASLGKEADAVYASAKTRGNIALKPSK